MQTTNELVQLTRVMSGIKELPGYSNIAISHVDALRRGSRGRVLAKQRAQMR